MSIDKRRLVGRKIVELRLNPFRARPDSNDRRVAYDPVFVLDNGAEIRFVVQETETGSYGIEPVYRPASRPR